MYGLNLSELDISDINVLISSTFSVDKLYLIFVNILLLDTVKILFNTFSKGFSSL